MKYFKILQARVLKLLRYSRKLIIAVFIIYCSLLQVYIKTVPGNDFVIYYL